MRFSTTDLDVEESFSQALNSDQSEFEKELSSGAVASASNLITRSAPATKPSETNQSSRTDTPAGGRASSDHATTNIPSGKPQSSNPVAPSGNRGSWYPPTPNFPFGNKQPSRLVASAGSSHTATANPSGNHRPSWLGPPGSSRPVTPTSYPASSHPATADPLGYPLPSWMAAPPSKCAPNHALPASTQRNNQPPHSGPPAKHPLSNDPSRRLPTGYYNKNGIAASGSGRVSKRGPKPLHARKYTSLLKAVLAKNQLSKGAATTTATSLFQHSLGPSPFGVPEGVKDQERPQETEPPSDIAETIMQADIEWERWVNLDLCDIDSTQEIGYDATPPLKMSVRPVDFKGNYGLVVDS